MKLNGNTHGPSDGAGNNKGRKKRGAGRTVLTVLCVIAVVAAAAVIGYTIWEKPPEIVTPTAQPTKEPIASPVPGVEQPEETPEPEDEFDGALVTDRSDGVYTILLVGRDHESNSTDTIIVGRFDTVNHTIECVNIPRDTLINISWAGTPKKINAVYPGFTNSGKSGIEGLLTHVKNLTGFDVDCYAVVNLKVVEDVINTIGGVYFDVPIDMDYDDGAQHFHVHLKSGYQQLNGYEALGVFRYRYGNDGNTYPGGDIQRIGVQQDLLKSIASQMLTLGNIPNLTTVIQLLVDNVETNLTASNMAFFARQFLKCTSDSISFHTAPFSNSCLINGVSFVSLDVDAWLELVNASLNPYTQPVTRANVNMLTSNADGTHMSATTGAIAGGDASFYCAWCAGHGMSPIYHAPGQCPRDAAPVETETPETEPPAETDAPVESTDAPTDPVPEETPEIITEIVEG